MARAKRIDYKEVIAAFDFKNFVGGDMIAKTIATVCYPWHATCFCVPTILHFGYGA